MGGATSIPGLSTFEPTIMASVLLKRVCFSLLVLVMMVFGGMLALLGILTVMLIHPRTLFRKIVRNGVLNSDN